MRKSTIIGSVCFALFGAAILVFFLVAGKSDPRPLVWWAYLIPLFFFALGAYIFLNECINAELLRAMQERNADRETEQQSPTSESTTESAAPPLTVRVFSVADPLPVEGGGGMYLDRIGDAKNFLIDQLRAGVKSLAWYNIAIAAVAQFLPAQYPFSQILFIAIIVTLVVRRKRLHNLSFIHRLTWLGLTYWFWIFATAVLTIFYLSVGLRNFLDLSVVFPSFGIVVIGTIALVSTRRRSRHMTIGKPELVKAARYNLLFLWVFKSSGSVWHFMSGIAQEWAGLGGTRLLGGGEFLGSDHWRLIWHWLRGRAGKFVIKTRKDLDRRMRLISAARATRFHTLVCNDAIWKTALDRLLNDSAIVLMNLSGLSTSNQGCLYEIEILFQRVPLSRVVFLIDSATDISRVRRIMEDVWQRLPVSSINRLGPMPVVWIVQLAKSMAEVKSAIKGEETKISTKVHADEVKRLIGFLCAALERSQIQSRGLCHGSSVA